jgi:hypothetical protein
MIPSCSLQKKNKLSKMKSVHPGLIEMLTSYCEVADVALFYSREAVMAALKTGRAPGHMYQIGKDPPFRFKIHSWLASVGYCCTNAKIRSSTN